MVAPNEQTFFNKGEDNYKVKHDIGSEGQDVTQGFNAGVRAYANATSGSVAFGRFIASDSDRKAVDLTKETSIRNIVGLTLQDPSTPVFEDGTTAYPVGRMMRVMEVGQAYVRAVTQTEFSGPVHLYVEGENVGRVGGIASTEEGNTTIELKSCFFEQDVAAGEIVTVNIQKLRTGE